MLQLFQIDSHSTDGNALLKEICNFIIRYRKQSSGLVLFLGFVSCIVCDLGGMFCVGRALGFLRQT